MSSVVTVTTSPPDIRAGADECNETGTGLARIESGGRSRDRALCAVARVTEDNEPTSIAIAKRRVAFGAMPPPDFSSRYRDQLRPAPVHDGVLVAPPKVPHRIAGGKFLQQILIFRSFSEGFVSLTRRDFIGAGAAAAAGLVLPTSAQASPLVSDILDRAELAPRPFAGRPVVVASANGIRGVARAYEMITKQNADPLDAAIAGVNIQELDPTDHSVGLGGLPNEEGVV